MAVRLRAAVLLTSKSGLCERITELPIAAWERCRRDAALYEASHARSWRVAAAACQRRLEYGLRDLMRQLEASHDELTGRVALRPATTAEIYNDLVALEDEFGSLRVDLQQRELAVATDPIAFEGISLGRFEIVLSWSHPATYRVVALDPNPSTDEDYVHPHVHDEELCEGDGQAAIRQALSSRRVLDFFTIVERTLKTYNSSSAFVRLDRWNGTTCSQCGYGAGDDEMSSCERCDGEMCSECGAGCGAAPGGAAAPVSHNATAVTAVSATYAGSGVKSASTNSARSALMKKPATTAETRPVANQRARKLLKWRTGRPRPIRRCLPRQSPSVRLSPTAWAKLLFLRDLGQTEIGGFGVSSLPDLLFVNDVRLVRQQCDWASVQFDDAAVADYFDAQVDAGRRPAEFGRIWVHTHPGTSALPSLTDEATFARVFGGCDWALMLIVARGGSSHARLQFGAGPGGAWEIPVEVDYNVEFTGSDWTAWQAEYAACVFEADPPPPALAGGPTSDLFAVDDYWLRDARLWRSPAERQEVES